ncbi:nucleoside triphosphate pyrophosphohydrolase [Corallococcus sp. AB049A]|uniref:Nucleoside triphosphate pyrophosphohydrolase n=1 Tax=Corallococcus interemptor TaxID=2316720 RepID=A0A3A8Q8P9_9BACT|nr:MULTISPECIES: nucleoside triphosphate pyrophosphohydrolase [Corallococcus]RKH65053.1 nucleoside triphosphate pyrophosphohydrolase [Corallococcus interemptor]RKI65949.1 nucleoside triphosphate pyrophosphohydrolase [Corallococcus sp. AB049A]
MAAPGAELERLVEIMRRLRAEGGCPWDREQDLRSLRPYLTEEAFEVLDEMDRVADGGPWRPLCEELGDLLFQIVFHTQLAAELGEFTMADVCAAISDKLTSRHPHVFGDQQVKGAEQVLANWAQLKAEERKKKTGRAGSVLDGVPTQAPSLLRAERLTEKASRIGFDWPDLAGVRGKLDEELRELDEAIASGGRDAIEHELGDVLFSLANLARFVKTPAEDALRMATRRFVTRFQYIEAKLNEEQVPFGGASLEHMERHWQAAKAVEKALPPPSHAPRASVATLRLAVPDVAAQRAFWDGVAAWLGWAPTRSPEGTAAYTGAGLGLVFTPGAQALAGSPVALTLEAPSQAAVARLQELFRAHHPGRLVAGASAETGFQFVDPAGLRWEYAAPPA